MTLLIRNATLLDVSATGEQTQSIGDVLLDGGKIVRVGQGLGGQADQVIDGSGKLVMPGLINAHLHSSETHLRGRYPGRPLEMWGLDVFPLRSREIHRHTDPRFVYLRCMVAGIQALKNGTTQILDDVIQRVNPTFELYGAAFQAYSDLGIRAAIGASFVNRNFCDQTPYFESLLPQHLAQELRNAPPQISVKEYLGLCERLARAYHQGPSGRTQFVIAPSAPQRCTDELLKESKAFANANGMLYTTHALETQVQYVTGLQQYGKSLIRHLDELGALDERTIIAHAIWTDDDDIRILADRGCTVSHNAVTNLRMASGILPWRKMDRAGVNIVLGTDSLCGNDSSRLFDVIRVAGLIHNITDSEYETAPSAGRILWSVTGGGARALGREKFAGKLAEGYDADLVLLDLDTPSFTPVNDLCNQLVFAENGSSISHVIVGGEVVVDHGKCVRVDEKAILKEFREACAFVLPEHIAAEEDSVEFRSAMREAYQKCCGETPLRGRLAI